MTEQQAKKRYLTPITDKEWADELDVWTCCKVLDLVNLAKMDYPHTRRFIQNHLVPKQLDRWLDKVFAKEIISPPSLVVVKKFHSDLITLAKGHP